MYSLNPTLTKYTNCFTLIWATQTQMSLAFVNRLCTRMSAGGKSLVLTTKLDLQLKNIELRLLVIQWLRIHSASTGDSGSILIWENPLAMAQSN